MPSKDISSATLEFFMTSILEVLNISQSQLADLLTNAEVASLRLAKLKVDEKKIHQKFRNSLRTGSLKVTTFKSLMRVIKALRIPRVEVRITLFPNFPREPIIIRKIIEFSVPDVNMVNRITAANIARKEKEKQKK